MAPLVMDPTQPPASHRVPLTCDRHPDESFTGFCTSCLRERLSGLDSTSTTRRNSTSTVSSSLKSIFFKPPAASSLQPELRRCKSFSCGRGDGASGGPRLSAAPFEPQRRSCDVRGRNTLRSLFNQENVSHSAAAGGGEIEEEGDEIVAVGTPGETQEKDEPDDLIKPMKDHIELESQAKRPPAKDMKEITGSFWLAASVFSKKLQKWRRKQKMKKMKKQEEDSLKSSTRFRETQSEIAFDAFGRRSLDIDPRFSLDAGRISFDDPRCSFDEPRASWDGYLIGARPVLSRPPPMLSVVEDSPIPAVRRTDGEIPVEEDVIMPVGSVQTNDCYSDSSSRSRRLSLDRSNSVRKLSSEVNEAKPVSNSKASPAGSAEFFRDWSSTSNSNSLRASESFESAFGKDSDSRKKQKRWSKAWSIWGLIHRRRCSRGGGNAADISFSESWPELRTNGYHANGGRVSRCNSNTSSRSSSYGNGGLGSMRRNGVETNGIGKKRRDEFVLERNRSARYSPGHVDNGMLRFYLTPMRGSRRGSAKGKDGNGYHSFSRSVLQLY